MAGFGYDDYQRVTNWDSPILYQDRVTHAEITVESPPIDVRRYESIGINGGAELQNQQWTLAWWEDLRLSAILGTRIMQVYVETANPIQANIVNLGPVLVLSRRAAAARWSSNLTVVGSNRNRPVEFVPRTGTLLQIERRTIRGRETASAFLTDIFGGPCSFFFQSNGTETTLSLNTFTEVRAESAQRFTTFVSTRNSIVREGIVLPPRSCRVFIENIEALECVISCAIVASYSGGT